MSRASYKSLAAEAAGRVREIMPWDLQPLQRDRPDLLILDVRERSEFDAVRIAGSLNVPRGILEAACEFDYIETVPELVRARERPIVIVCRSGNRSALAAEVMQAIGYANVRSMRLGLKGWNDADLPLVDGRNLAIDPDQAAVALSPPVATDQMDPARLRSQQ